MKWWPGIFWPDGRAVGRAGTIGGVRAEIIGVVGNVQYLGAFEQPEPVAYFNFWPQDTTDNWAYDSRTHVRVAGKAETRLPQILRVIAAIDPDVPVSEAQALGTPLDTAFSQVRATRAFLLVFGGLALVLSMLGLYAALAFAVGQRTRELAIRIEDIICQSRVLLTVAPHGFNQGYADRTSSVLHSSRRAVVGSIRVALRAGP